MTTKYRTASQLGKAGDEIAELLEALEGNSHKINGGTFEQVKHILGKAMAAYNNASKAKSEDADGDVVIIEGDEPPVKTKSKRPRRIIPAGTFVFRPRQAKYKGKTYAGATIAHMFCKIAQDIVDGDGEVDEKGIAEAIQVAYPENNYRPHRVEIDLDKFQHGKFRCQRVPAEYDAAVEDEFGG